MLTLRGDDEVKEGIRLLTANMLLTKHPVLSSQIKAENNSKSDKH